jgi:secondary thiamine-phosphate synthase enzyme
MPQHATGFPGRAGPRFRHLFTVFSSAGRGFMIVATTRLEISTDEGVSLADVTSEVNAFIKSSGVASGLCIVSTASAGSCLTLSAEFDEDVDDLLRLARTHLTAMAATEHPDRIDIEGAGYIPAGVLADCVSLPIRDGAVGVGSWEAIVLLDGRGPATRPIEITVMGN